MMHTILKYLVAPVAILIGVECWLLVSGNRILVGESKGINGALSCEYWTGRSFKTNFWNPKTAGDFFREGLLGIPHHDQIPAPDECPFVYRPKVR